MQLSADVFRAELGKPKEQSKGNGEDVVERMLGCSKEASPRFFWPDEEASSEHIECPNSAKELNWSGYTLIPTKCRYDRSRACF